MTTADVGVSKAERRTNAARAGVLHTVWTYLNTAPAQSAATIGRAVLLAGSVIRHLFADIARRKFPVDEVLDEMWLLLKVTMLPALLMAVPLGAEVSVQVGGLMNQVGASSLAGAASGLGVVSQGAPMAAGLLMAGAAASAIASDLGSRAIREEIDAMRVMGIDPVQRLVMPRFIATIVIAPMLCVVIIAAGVAAGLLIAVNANDVVPGSFWQSFGAFTTPTDIWFAIAKSFVFAALVVLIASIRGLEARGGPRGVADAVNASVVLSVVAIFLANLVISQFRSMFFQGQLG
ncbi:ABC transporter permease [Rhodococcus sp. 15-725-2-2b]|uniref:MlaE family ABC transporter permease n=1 Tax=unclassified Rhodococcus (in: high G+C Gram-positive bacteria) TaxID=192944 RepID=UPI000B9A2B69|nr:MULTISPECIES: ABC transporter permease [unclassified Rhodococcus (in: high G+C Gram-positive bacteria)]OZC63664.1 ABC transporter permease [Rhodococcus sp. 06-469-3-2]OZD40829.1 ABC transporter permease [Rhodococcus sp. 06-1477-1A]OZE67063.1 ABC transporter permease [Rhodococcus sp. 15-725-2-2b]